MWRNMKSWQWSLTLDSVVVHKSNGTKWQKTVQNKNKQKKIEHHTTEHLSCTIQVPTFAGADKEQLQSESVSNRWK